MIWIVAICGLVVIIAVASFLLGVLHGEQRARIHWTYRDEQWANHLEENQ